MEFIVISQFYTICLSWDKDIKSFYDAVHRITSLCLLNSFMSEFFVVKNKLITQMFH